MRKIILNLAVTLDGFIEGPNGEIDWCQMEENADSNSFFDRFLAGIDTIFYGRVSYDLWGQYQPAADASTVEKKLWETVHRTSKYVFTRNPPKDKTAAYIDSDITNRVQEIKSQTGKDIWLYGGANLITDFINEGLVDNYLLAVFPVILGSGKLLFANIQHRVGLTLNSVESSASGVVLLSYDAKK